MWRARGPSINRGLEAVARRRGPAGTQAAGGNLADIYVHLVGRRHAPPRDEENVLKRVENQVSCAGSYSYNIKQISPYRCHIDEDRGR